MKFLKIFFIILVFTLFHQKSYSELTIDAKHVILQDHLSGEILYEKDTDSKIPTWNRALLNNPNVL